MYLDVLLFNDMSSGFLNLYNVLWESSVNSDINSNQQMHSLAPQQKYLIEHLNMLH
jgi:hypothetical protein